MTSPYTTPSLEYGQDVRRLHALRRWVEVREFYRALFRRKGATVANAFTTLTINVWERPERFR